MLSLLIGAPRTRSAAPAQPLPSRWSGPRHARTGPLGGLRTARLDRAPAQPSAASAAAGTDAVTGRPLVVPVVPGRSTADPDNRDTDNRDTDNRDTDNRDTADRDDAPGPAVRSRPPAGRASPAPAVAGLGTAWVLALSSVGVLLVSVAYTGSRAGWPAMMVAYWAGQLLVFTPVVARLLARRAAATGEVFALVIGLALNQYLQKWMYSPDEFRFPDELQHWVATTIIMQTGELFQPNPALPPAVHFPGLAEMGAAVASLTGLPVTAAGFLVAGVAHLAFVGLLYAVVLRVVHSAAAAGLTCVVYSTALHYLFFDSMYLYQTAALPFLMLAVWAARNWRPARRTTRPYAVVGLVAVIATTMSHHVTAAALVGTLTLLAAVELIPGGRKRRWNALLPPAAAAVVVALWIFLVARDVLDYLQEPLADVTAAAHGLLDGAPEAAPAAPTPWWQLAIQAVGLLLLFSLFAHAVQTAVRERTRDPWRWAPLAGAAMFFAGNAVRFFGAAGPELAGRASTFTYIPMSMVAAGVLLGPVGRRRARCAELIAALRPGLAGLVLSRIVVGSLVATVLLVGARVGGWPPASSLLPGGHLVSGFERSVDAPGVSAARWTAEMLGPGHRIAADLTGVTLISTYGRQDPIREAAPLYYAQRWGMAEDELATDLAVNYLWVDLRLTRQLPASGRYFEVDPLAGRHTSPLPRSALAKFDQLPFTDLIYDNGEIRIYRLGGR